MKVSKILNIYFSFLAFYVGGNTVCQAVDKYKLFRIISPSNVTYLFNGIEAIDDITYDNYNHGIKLGIDQAVIQVFNANDFEINVTSKNDECYLCLNSNISVITPRSNESFIVDTRWPINLLLLNNSGYSLCSFYQRFIEHGEYVLHIIPNDCRLTLINNPKNEYLPIYITVGVLFGCAFLWILIKFMLRQKFVQIMISKFTGTRNIDIVIIQDEPKEKPERLKSLDTFRGLSLVVMIFVNYNGGKYWFFDHSPWDGLTVADLVFPWFTFIMGTSISLSLRSLVRKKISKWKLLWKILKRTFILFSIGLCLGTSSGPIDMKKLRIPGVLQRLALSYFGVAIFHIFFARMDDSHKYVKWGFIRDVVLYWPEWLIMLGLLSIHICLTFLFHDPACPKGYLGPGGLHDYGRYWNCTGGAAGYIDRLVFKQHIYQNPTPKELYMTTLAYDPEGILGTLTAIFMCFLGLQAGKILLHYKDVKNRVIRWLFWGILTGLIGGSLCQFKKFSGVIPINKNLWSVSFIFALSSMAYFSVAAFFMIIDVFKIWSGSPFIYPGKNSIAVYVCHSVFSRYFPIKWKVDETHLAHLGMAVYGASLWTIFAFCLHRKKIFIKI